MTMRLALGGLALVLQAAAAQAVEWSRHDILTEAGRPLLVAGAGATVEVGETPAFFRRVAAGGAECEAKDGKTGRIRIVCTGAGGHPVTVYIGAIVDAGKFLIQQVAIDTRMLPAAERVAHMRTLTR
ncbi:hypothetical protein [Methylobacterium indicum]|uniref:hypothetical protein n=1 Tax=Methylobacterium indicum TaxID=1775910 RepID=UPI0024358E12|nr:hypothetical protein [Methylobacterium indicum]